MKKEFIQSTNINIIGGLSKTSIFSKVCISNKVCTIIKDSKNLNYIIYFDYNKKITLKISAPSLGKI